MEGVTKEDEDELLCSISSWSSFVDDRDGQNTNVFCTVVDVKMMVSDDEERLLAMVKSSLVVVGVSTTYLFKFM